MPKLRAAIDAGKPQVLCLIRSSRPDGIAQNHQVVAVGYAESDDGVSVVLYDPNHPGKSPTIDFVPTGMLNRIRLRQSTGEPIVGFFVWPHEPQSA